MVGVFKQKNPGNTLLLFIYALVLKFQMLVNPSGPLQQSGDHYLYTQLIKFLGALQFPPVIYSVLTFIILFGEALLLNRIFNAQKMIAKPTFLPAMAFMLISSLFVEWNRFSAPLLINGILIWVFYRMMTLYNVQRAGNAIFNIGLLLGIITLLYHPAIVFVLLIVFHLVYHASVQDTGMADRIFGINDSVLFPGHSIIFNESMELETLGPISNI